MRKLICLFIIVITIFPLGGCWSMRGLNEIAIVLAAGVDRAPDNKITLTVQIAKPRAFSGPGQQSSSPQELTNWVISQVGETIFDAQRHLEAKVSRELYWGHDVILVIGEQLARDGVQQALNLFTRSPEARETIWVLVAEGKASDVLNSHSMLENTSAQDVGAMLRSGVGPQVMAKDLSMMLASPGTNPVLPQLRLTPSGNRQGPGMFENIRQEQGVQQQNTGTHASATITGTGVFRDDRLIGWLDMLETRGLMWLKDQISEGEVTIPSPNEPGKNISFHISRANTEVEPFYDGQNIWFDVTIKMDGDLWEQQSTEKIINPDIIKSFENEISHVIEKRCRLALQKAQTKYGVDIFGFGEAFHRKYKNDWAMLKDRWDEAFSNADVNIRVEAHIKRSGLTTNRLSIELE